MVFKKTELLRKVVYEDNMGLFEAYIYPKSKNDVRIKFINADYHINLTKEDVWVLIIALTELHRKMEDAIEDKTK